MRSFFKPLLIGKFAEQYDQVPMSFMWARIVKRTLKLGTYTGGFQAFLDELAGQLRAQWRGDSFERAPVEEICLREGKPALKRIGGQLQGFRPRAQHDLAAAAAEHDAGLARYGLRRASGGAEKHRRALRRLCAQTAADAGRYLLAQSAGDNGGQNSRSDFPFLALVEHTNYISREHYGGDHIVYCGDYVPPDHEYFQLSEDRVGRALPARADDDQPRLFSATGYANAGSGARATRSPFRP